MNDTRADRVHPSGSAPLAPSRVQAERVSVSVIVPVYSGADYLAALVEELDRVGKEWASGDAPVYLAEVILVDDAAIDSSAVLVDRLAEQYPFVTSIHLARNFGQHPATIAGILHSSGDWVVTLDEDLQHPPSRIDDLFREVAASGCDVVYAKAQDAVHDSYVRDLGSIWFKRLIEKFSGNPNVRHFNSFRLIRGPVARAASSVCTHDTYFDVALSWFTQRVGAVQMQLKDERFIRSGKSGYKFSKLLSHARRMLMSSGTKVIRVSAMVGLIVVLVSTVFGLFLLAQRIMFPETISVTGWTSMMLTVMFFGGIITFLLGVALEYLSLLVLNAHGKPIFFTVDRSKDGSLSRFFGT
jgi:undecaprenyl-phosphate 4-deoxy-4-formamido-L-arabinose transferase